MNKKLATTALLLLSTLVFAYGQKTFNWTPPTQNTDGSPLPDAEIGSYNIYCDGNLIGTVTNTGNTSSWQTPVGTFPPGDYTCTATAINTAGIESAQSNAVNFTVAASVPNPPVLSVN